MCKNVDQDCHKRMAGEEVTGKAMSLNTKHIKRSTDMDIRKMAIVLLGLLFLLSGCLPSNAPGGIEGPADGQELCSDSKDGRYYSGPVRAYSRSFFII